MAGSFVVHGDGTITVAFSYTALADIVQATADAGAHALYTGEAEAWDDLSNQDKLDLLDGFVLSGIRELALGYLHNVRQAEARAHREEDVATVL